MQNKHHFFYFGVPTSNPRRLVQSTKFFQESKQKSPYLFSISSLATLPLFSLWHAWHGLGTGFHWLEKAYIEFMLKCIREGSKKKSGKKMVFCQPPLGPPPAPLFGLFWSIFRWNFFFFIFLMENRSIMPETDFKQKKIFDFFFLTDHYLPKSRWSIKSKEKPLKFNFQSYFNGFKSDIHTPVQV